MPGSLLVADLDTLGDARLVEMEDLVFGVAGRVVAQLIGGGRDGE
tara:strand:- start:174 stop:308 length:135 start_codon:yes stop_codon:yes gene_type:complete